MPNVLTQVAIFKGIPLDGLARLAEQGIRRTFPAGSQLMRQGEPGDTLHIVAQGLVVVERSHPALTDVVVLAELGPGEVVGEMGVLDGDPRSATVTAVEETETLELSADAVAEIITRHPEVSAVLLRTLSCRLRSTDELVAQMLSKTRGQAERAANGPF